MGACSLMIISPLNLSAAHWLKLDVLAIWQAWMVLHCTPFLTCYFTPSSLPGGPGAATGMALQPVLHLCLVVVVSLSNSLVH